MTKSRVLEASALNETTDNSQCESLFNQTLI
jgi:hypothetical protein